MANEPPRTRDERPAEARYLRTSQLLRRAASELANDSPKHPGERSRSELAHELEVRALWIERGRANGGLSDERTCGVATIEGVDRSEAVGWSGRLRCSASGPCDFHRDGGPAGENCPGQCDAPGCTLDGYYEVGVDYVVCAVHGAIVLLARAVSEALVVDNAEEANTGR